MINTTILDIEDLVKNGDLRDEALINDLKELINDNKAINSANIAVLKLKDGELSKNDAKISLNRYKSEKFRSLGD